VCVRANAKTLQWAILVDKNNVLTKEELLRLKQEDKTDKQIAQLYNLSPDYVVYLKERFHLPKEKPGRKRKIKVTRDELVAMQSELKVDRLIAKKLGVTAASVAALRRQLNIPMLHKGTKEKVADHQPDQGRIRFLYERIVEIRRERGFKQYDFARKIGISPAYLRRTEHGIIYPPLKLLIDIFNGLSINPAYIFLESETKKYLP
jgi:DNA-binding XRE family transcriptional regulator